MLSQLRTVCFIALLSPFAQSAPVAAPSSRCELLAPDAQFVQAMLEEQRAQRTALVIGNNAYQTFPSLQNARRDATALSNQLQALGFTVRRLLDADTQTFEDCASQFVKSAQGADVALMFYAGHGLQVEGENYLVSVDAQVGNDAANGIRSVSRLAIELNRSAKTSILILDSCRDNPFRNQQIHIIDGVPTRTIPSIPTRGVVLDMNAKKPSDAPGAGMYLAFATSPDKTASDGADENSPFTRALLQNIALPGHSIQRVMADVSRQVGETTQYEQTPWTSSSLASSVFLNGSLDEVTAREISRKRAEESRRMLHSGARNDAIAAALKGLPLQRDAWSESVFEEARRALLIATEARSARLDYHDDVIATIDPRGHRVATYSFNPFVPMENREGLKLWDARTGKLIVELLPASRAGTETWTGWQARFSSDGQYIASRSVDGNLHVWNAETGTEVSVLPIDPSGDPMAVFTFSVGFGGNGKRLIAASSAIVTMWEIESGKKLATWDARDWPGVKDGFGTYPYATFLTEVTFDQSGALAIVLGNSGGWFSATIETDTGKARHVVPIPTSVMPVTSGNIRSDYSYQRKLLVSCIQNTVVLIDPFSGTLKNNFTISGSSCSPSVSPLDDVIVVRTSFGEDAEYYDAKTGRRIADDAPITRALYRGFFDSSGSRRAIIESDRSIWNHAQYTSPVALDTASTNLLRKEELDVVKREQMKYWRIRQTPLQ